MTVGRPPNVLRPCKLSVYLPEDLKAKLDLHLFSAVEGRIPHGAYSGFFADRVREFFSPASANSKFEALKLRIEQAEVTAGWSEEQRTAMESFRDHILQR